MGPDGQVVSPFAAAGAGAASGGQGQGREEAPLVEEEPLDPDRELLPLTMDNVDEALNEVRPFLIADGGNVDVVGIEDGIVAVRMNGACGSCSSSTATLKVGASAAHRALNIVSVLYIELNRREREAKKRR